MHFSSNTHGHMVTLENFNNVIILFLKRLISVAFKVLTAVKFITACIKFWDKIIILVIIVYTFEVFNRLCNVTAIFHCFKHIAINVGAVSKLNICPVIDLSDFVTHYSLQTHCFLYKWPHKKSNYYM